MAPVYSSKSKSSLAMQPPAKKFFDLANNGLVLSSSAFCAPNFLQTRWLKLVLWDIFLGVPVSYVLTTTNKRVIQYLGYEKIMRCPSGIFFSRLLFVTLNMVIVIAWAIQLVQEEYRRVEILKDISFWDEEIIRLQVGLTFLEQTSYCRILGQV